MNGRAVVAEKRDNKKTCNMLGNMLGDMVVGMLEYLGNILTRYTL